VAWELATATRNAAVDAVVDLIDGGAAAGTMQIRTGAKPGVGSAASGTLLATVTFIDPAFGAASSGSATVADPVAVTAVADGTAGHVRVLDSNATVIMDGTVTATGGGGDVTLASTSISTGQSVDITGGSITMPSGA
jgi:hypothetical protein